MILSYERVILLALYRMFGPEYFNSSKMPIVYCSPDPVLFEAIKRTVIQVILFTLFLKIFFYDFCNDFFIDWNE